MSDRQSGRQQRRAAQSSPYSRRDSNSKGATTNGASNTPSRLGSLFSTIMSPFRSANKPVQARRPVETIEIDDDDDDDDDDDEMQLVKDDRMAIEDTVIPPHTSSHVNDAPPSPSYSNNSVQSTSTSKQPQPTQLSPSRATEELARFFADRSRTHKDEPLTAVEEAGVLQLMQQARGTSTTASSMPGHLPTAFTPSFGRMSPSPSMPNVSLPTSVSFGSALTAVDTQLFSPAPASPRIPSSNSLFNVSASVTAPTTPASSYRRRRPVYVGAGYSSQSARRRRPVASSARPGASTSAGALGRSQSESTLSSVADGKRRRIDHDDEDAPPVNDSDRLFTASGSSSALASSSSLTRSQTTTSLSAPASTVKSSLPRSSTVLPSRMATPARPSPLWQVSKADTPSPSPPATKTLAADIILSVIKDTPSPSKSVPKAVENPYEGLDNPIGQIAKSSRSSKAASPRKAVAAPPLRRSARAKSPLASSVIEKEQASLNDIELLERSMPPELRASTTTASSSFSFASKQASAAPKTTTTTTTSAGAQNLFAPVQTVASRTRARSKSPEPTFTTVTAPAAAVPAKKALAPAMTTKAKAKSPEADIVILSDSEDDAGEQEEEEEEEEDASMAEDTGAEATAEEETGEEELGEDEEGSQIEVDEQDEDEEEYDSTPVSSAASATSGPTYAFGAFQASQTSVPVFSFGSNSPSPAPPSAASIAAAATLASPKGSNMPMFPTSSGATFSFGGSAGTVGTSKAAAPVSFAGSAVDSNDDDDEARAKKEVLETDRTKLPLFAFYSEPIFGATKAKAKEGEDGGAKDLVARMSRNELPSFAFT